MSAHPYAASCICGAARLRLPGPPARTVLCHCTACRRTAGADYATICPYPAPAFEVETPDAFASYRVGAIERFWCKTCGCNVFLRNANFKIESVYMSAVTSPPFASDLSLPPPPNEPSWLPSRHIFYASGIRDVRDGLPKFADYPKEIGGSGEVLPDDFHAGKARAGL
ncbi:Mss4-like protein [Hyaloraphidium curvatum]|nr:Mss4-like protein [Hyaloraphidium curvatum]